MKSLMKVVRSQEFVFFLVAIVIAGLAIHSTGNRKNRFRAGYANVNNEANQEANNDTGVPGMLELESERSELDPSLIQSEANDLLPNPQEDDKFNAAGGPVLNNNNLVSSFKIPMLSQTLRNANLQIRSEPPNPQTEVCAWNQSTIQPDQHRRSLDICNE